ncbi:hypothetical protein CLV32_3253 [Pedobacter duraquae]|uniref:Uncharacterized protein n=2 Tax=Pedobacter duraquae TaxID=425511 RepID=A0A4R6IEB1_9SPHI|nr:hypothetical protein CLV32_3253 [Pedobacter duraquae]
MGDTRRMTIKTTFSVLLVLFSLSVAAQKTQVQIARNALGKLQSAIVAGQDSKKQIIIIGEGIKATELAKKDRRTKNWPETWAISAYLTSYLALIDENDQSSEQSFSAATESIDSAKTYDKYQDNSNLINAALLNVTIKKQDKGNAAYNAGDYVTAYAYLKEVSDFFPKDSTLAINTALAAQNIRSYDNALVYFKRAKDNGVKNPVLFQSLANLYAGKFDTENAIKTLQEGLKLNPYNTFITYDYINILLDNEHYAEASQVIENSLKVENRNKLLFYLYGYLQQVNGNNATAELAYKRALGLDQNYYDALYQLGLAYINTANEQLKSNQKDHVENFTASMNRAEFTLLQAHEINPNDKSAIQLLIDIYTRKNRLDKVQELKRKLQEF